MEKEVERGQCGLFITVNPDTVAFSAHMDWIIGYAGCICMAQQRFLARHTHTHTHTNISLPKRLKHLEQEDKPFAHTQAAGLLIPKPA